MEVKNFHNIINQFKNDDEMLEIITNNINELKNLDPVWEDTILKISEKKITKKFARKIKNFFSNIKNINYLLILNILLESYDTIEDLNPDIKEIAFYVILRELTKILNKKNNSFHQNYTDSLKFLKVFRKYIYY